MTDEHAVLGEYVRPIHLLNRLTRQIRDRLSRLCSDP